MERARAFLRGLWRDESGISSVEYALLLAMIAGGIIIAAEELANAVENQMQDTADCLNSTATC